MKRRVFISSEDPRLNFAPALKFGDELIGVFPPGQVHLHPQHALMQAHKTLSAMRPDDYLVLSGDPVKIAICVTVAAWMHFKVRMLRWDRQTASYVEVAVDFREMKDLLPTID